MMFLVQLVAEKNSLSSVGRHGTRAANSGTEQGADSRVLSSCLSSYSVSSITHVMLGQDLKFVLGDDSAAQTWRAVIPLSRPYTSL